MAVLLTGTVLGLLMGLLIHYFDIQPFIATLAGLFLARGLTYLISVESISISDETFTQLAFKTLYFGDYYIRWTAISRWRRWRSRPTSWPAPASAARSTPSAAARARRC